MDSTISTPTPNSTLNFNEEDPITSFDLDTINDKLSKYGIKPLPALYDVHQCAICFDNDPDNMEWSLVTPCGHLVCTECMKQMYQTQHKTFTSNQHIVPNDSSIKCPLCATVGIAFRIKSKTNIQNGQPTKQVIPIGIPSNQPAQINTFAQMMKKAKFQQVQAYQNASQNTVNKTINGTITRKTHARNK